MSDTSAEIVVLLHGIGLSKHSLFLLERSLRKRGYKTLSITYPSTKMPLDNLAVWLREKFLTHDFWDTYSRVHFVTHSMGGLVVRKYLHLYSKEIPSSKIGRTVMLGTPNKGSEIADFLENFPPYKWIFGPAGKELTTSTQGSNSDPVFYDIGVIAGTGGWLYPLSSLFFSGPHDGRVTVESTKIDGMKDHFVCKYSHTFMIYHSGVWAQAIHFLENGVFDHDA